MRRLCAILILAAFVALTALTPLHAGSTKFVFTWMNPTFTGAHFKTILVLGINGKAVNRAEFEDQLSAGITRPGIVAIPSYSLLPRPNSTPLDMNQLRDVVQGQSIDAIVASRLIKVKKSVIEIPGQVYTPYPYYNSFYGYYGTIYPEVYSPDYLRVERTAQIETNFYSTLKAEGELIWTGTSDSVNPQSPLKAIDAVAKIIVQQLEKEKII
ncbi:MAG TPA: hypothetical protein VN881_06160 [Candidatus Acidoferrales bacterium]|nr:hypothetical protein [Candidatus Acidoferrales bacterium]